MREDSATTTYLTVEARLQETITSQQLEGLQTPPEEQTMLRRLSRGETSLSEYQEWAKTTYLR